MAEQRSFPAMEDNSLLQNPRFFFPAILLFIIFLLFLSPFPVITLGVVSRKWPADRENRLSTGSIEFAGEVFGPESIEFDRLGRGPYSGLADGRVVRWMGQRVGWETFALVSRNWSETLCANGVESTTTNQHEKEEQCGRPLGLRFEKKTGDLYIADAYYGLMVAGANGGAAVTVTDRAEGKPILFTNDLDIHSNGSLFFTDTSMRHNRRNHLMVLIDGDTTGRLLRYDPLTRTTHVVLKGLAFPNGVQLSRDQTFLLYTETTKCRVMRLWLEGPKNGHVEVFANLPGFPDNIRINGKGHFWVAIDCCYTRSQAFLSKNPLLRSFYFGLLPLKTAFLARLVGMKQMYTVIARLNEAGVVVEVLQDGEGKVARLVSEVREEAGKLWIGTVAHNHIATMPY